MFIYSCYSLMTYRWFLLLLTYLFLSFKREKKEDESVVLLVVSSEDTSLHNPQHKRGGPSLVS